MAKQQPSRSHSRPQTRRPEPEPPAPLPVVGRIVRSRAAIAPGLAEAIVSDIAECFEELECTCETAPLDPQAAAQSVDGVLFLFSDAALLVSPDYLEDLLAALEEVEAVVVPSFDGGVFAVVIDCESASDKALSAAALAVAAHDAAGALTALDGAGVFAALGQPWYAATGADATRAASAMARLHRLASDDEGYEGRVVDWLLREIPASPTGGKS